MVIKIQNVLIFTHSFVCWLAYDLDHNFIERAVESFNISDAVVHFAGVSSQMVLKLVQYDLDQVINFKPDNVILEIGANDLTDLRPEVVGSEIEELVCLLHELYDVKSIAVSTSTMHRQYQSVDDMIWNWSWIVMGLGRIKGICHLRWLSVRHTFPAVCIVCYWTFCVLITMILSCWQNCFVSGNWQLNQICNIALLASWPIIYIFHLGFSLHYRSW